MRDLPGASFSQFHRGSGSVSPGGPQRVSNLLGDPEVGRHLPSCLLGAPPWSRGNGMGRCGGPLTVCAPLPQKSRYGTYAALLRIKLKAACEELDAVEAALAQAGCAEDGLPPSHSSPSLQPNPSSQPRAQRHGSEPRAGAGSGRWKP